MPIFALTSNPHKHAEYAAHFGLYGISTSLRMADPASEEVCKAMVLASDDRLNFVFREEADLYDLVTLLPIERPYRVPANAGRRVLNISRATVLKPMEGVLVSETFEHRITGTITFDRQHPDAFNWDDVFQPDGHNHSLYSSSITQGKVSARNLVLDDIIASYLPFQSQRAFKYGRLNAHGLVDLNHWPIDATTSVAFDHLPIDVLRTNTYFQRSALHTTPVGRMFDAALSEGAHFRAASDRRSWLYWAPGINAGVPLTPKEDPAAELIYLAHDFAHYAMPDLLIDTPAGPDDRIALAHRMISETLAMVSADMFVMDAFVQHNVPCDPIKHAIHPILNALRQSGLEGVELFDLAVTGAVESLLGGDSTRLRRYASDTMVDRFLNIYTRFALADYDWTLQNLTAFHKAQQRQERWVGALPPQVLHDLNLQTASGFIVTLPENLAQQPFAQVLQGVLRAVLDTRIHPLMTTTSSVNRDDTLALSIRRYLVGQRALYARYPDAIPQSACLPLVDEVIAGRADAASNLPTIQAGYQKDLQRLLDTHQITPLDAKVYAVVFPIVQPHYVSYAKPNIPNHAALFAHLDAQV